jgi:hypothetical protein
LTARPQRLSAREFSPCAQSRGLRRNCWWSGVAPQPAKCIRRNIRARVARDKFPTPLYLPTRRADKRWNELLHAPPMSPELGKSSVQCRLSQLRIEHKPRLRGLSGQFSVKLKSASIIILVAVSKRLVLPGTLPRKALTVSAAKSASTCRPLGPLPLHEGHRGEASGQQ